MTTLSFQPEADRYYAEGYWRSGDLWRLRRPAHAQPDKVALVLDDRRITYDELRRAAVALSARLAARSVHRATSSCCSAATRSRRRSRCSRCLHRGVVLAPLPPMFNVTPARGAGAADRRAGDRGLRRREGAREVRAGRADRRAADLAAAGDAGRADRRGRHDQRARERRRRHRDGHASSGTTSAPKGIVTRAIRCATRPRASAGAGGSAATTSTSWRPIRLRRRHGVRQPARAAQRRHGRADEPVEARGGASAHRGAPLHATCC